MVTSARRAAADEVAALVEEVRAEFAPDPRLAVFEVTVEVRGDAVALLGATSEQEAALALSARIAQLTGWRACRTRCSASPRPSRTSWCTRWSPRPWRRCWPSARVRTTQVSQVVLGNRLVVLRRSGRWLQCRSPEGYIGWVHAGYVALRDEGQVRALGLGRRAATPASRWARGCSTRAARS